MFQAEATHLSLTAEVPPPQRAVAVVLDASRNMSPQCFEDWNTANYVPSGAEPLFAGFTRTLCDSVPRWQHQRDGLIQALRTTVPLDGSVAVSVVLDAINQVGHGYDGPSVVVPYTVIRTEADRNAVIDQLRNVQPSIDHPSDDWTYNWEGSNCKGSYDSTNHRCYSPAAHAWAAQVAHDEIARVCSDAATGDAGTCQRPKKIEICMVGDAVHGSVPVAFWARGAHCSTTLNGDPGCEVNWPANVPEEAKQPIPFESIAAVDRFTVVQHDVGLSQAMFAASTDEQSARPNPLFDTDYAHPAWGAAITIESLPLDQPPATGGQIHVMLGEVVTPGTAAARQIADVPITVAAGASPEEVANEIYQALQSRLTANPASLPVRAYLLGRRVLFDWNPSFDFNGDNIAVLAPFAWNTVEMSGDGDHFPVITVSNTYSALGVTVSGGALSPYERVLQHQQVSLAHQYGGVLSGRGNLVFPSGFLPSAVDHDDDRRAVEFGGAITRCFEACNSDDVIEDDQRTVEGTAELLDEEQPLSLAAPVALTAAETSSSAQMCSPVTLVAVEVNQVIQTWDNEIPLIKNKLGAVRVHLEAPDGAKGVKTRLRGFAYKNKGEECSPLAGDENCKREELSALPVKVVNVQTSATEYRKDLSASAMFMLPKSWTRFDLLELKVETVGKNKLVCKEHSDATPGNDCKVQVRFTQHQRPLLANPPGLGDGRGLAYQPTLLGWDEGDLIGDLAATSEEAVLTAVGIERMLPLDLEVRPAHWLAADDVVKARKAAGWFVPDIAWYREKCPECSPSDPEIEQQWLAEDYPNIGTLVSAFRTATLTPLLVSFRSRSFDPNDPRAVVLGGLYHTPLQRFTGGVSRQGTGTFTLDVGGGFLGVSDAAAHEFVHAVGRSHTDYCMDGAPADQRPGCDEPYPWELVEPNAEHTRPGQIRYPDGDHPPDTARPAIGPVGDPWTEVWGLELGLRYARTQFVPFPRSLQSSAAGLSPIKPRAFSPRSTYDIMSYCHKDGSTTWMSKFQYERLLRPTTTLDFELIGDDLPRFSEYPWRANTPVAPRDALKWCANESERRSAPRWAPFCDPMGASTTCPASDTLISGVFDPASSTLEWNPALRVDEQVRDPGEEESGVKQGIFSLRDASGNELYRISAPLSDALEQTTGGAQGALTFHTAVPLAGVQEIALLEGGVELGHIRRTASTPSVTIDAALQGTAIDSDKFTFRWSGTDADNDQLYYVLDYSADDGATFTPISAATREEQLTYPTKFLPGSSTARLRVTVSDGFDSTRTVSGRFSVARKAPEAVIVSLLDDQIFSGSDTILLDARAFDREDGQIADDSLVWTSDRSGQLGVGRTLVSALDLAEGIHNISVRATDHDGVTASTTKRIEIRRFDTEPFIGPRLKLDCTHGGDLEVNQLGTYVLRVTNVGAGAARGKLTIRDTLPDKLSYVDASGDGWTCTDGQGFVTCNRPDSNLEPGAAAPLVSVRVLPRYPDQAPATAPFYDVTNVGEAFIENGGPDSESRALDPTRVRVPLMPALDISTSGPSTTVVGKPLTYRLDIANTGAGPAYDLTVDFSVPPRSAIQSADGDDWSCTVAAQSGRCVSQISPVSSGATLPQLQVVVIVSDPNLTHVQLSYQVTAKGSANPSDAGVDAGVTSTAGGNTSATQVEEKHAPGADLSIRVLDPCEDAPYWEFCQPGHYVYPSYGTSAAFSFVRGDAARVRGGTWSHTVVVKNVGVQPAYGVEFSWLLPADATWHPQGSASGSAGYYEGDWFCSQEEHVVRCTYERDPLGVGEEVSLALIYGISKTAAPSFVHAFQTTAETDTDPSNDRAEHVTALYATAQVCLMLDDSGRCVAPSTAPTATSLTSLISITDPLVVGETGEATFTVRNNGSAAVRKNTISLKALGDPSLLSVTGYSGAGWSCGLSWGRATCLYFDPLNQNLASGQTLAPLTVTFRVGPHPYEFMRIPAEVTATGLPLNRTSITAAVQQKETLHGPATGTLAYTACPPGLDCNQYLATYPTNYTQGNRQIRLLDLATLESSQVLPEATAGKSDQRVMYEEPAWAPDGARFAYLLRVGACTPEPDDDCESSLEVHHLNSRFVPLYFAASQTRQAQVGVTSETDGAASWAPDGAHLVFPGASFVRPTATCAPQYFGDTNDDCFKLRVTNAMGSRTVFGSGSSFPDSLVLAEPGGGVLHPDWSPTGTVIAYISGSPSKIWLVDVANDGTSPTNKRRLTAAASSVVEERPDFSPDGTRIAFSSNGNLHVTRVDGTTDFVLTSSQSDTHPTWSPDGTQIAFERGGSDPGIFIVPASGGSAVLVARGMHPAWRPQAAAPSVTVGVQPPSVGADRFSTTSSLPVTGNVLANDTDPASSTLSLVSFDQAARGNVSCTAAGSCSYTPTSGFLGQDAFNYTVQNAAGARATGTVRVDVNGVLPQLVIETPVENASVDTFNGVSVSGRAALEYQQPTLNVLYAVDENNATGGPGTAESNGNTISSSGLPFIWQAPADGHSSLCGDPNGAPDSTLIDCYVSTLNQGLIGRPSVNVGALMFADDVMGTKPNADLWLMQSARHSPIDYRPNVFSLDLAPTSGHDLWIPAGLDSNANGRPDVDDVLRSVSHFAPGTISCGWPNSVPGTDPNFTAGGRLFGAPLGRATPPGDPRLYGRDITCRGTAPHTQTYDWVLDSINKSFASRSPIDRNVAFLISSGRSLVSEDVDSPLQEAIRRGTIIHTFAPKAPPKDPVEVVLLVNSNQSSAAERAHMATRLSRFASQLSTSGLDYRVTLFSSSDWFAGTDLNHTYIATGADATATAIDSFGNLSLQLRPDTTVHIVTVNVSDASTRLGRWALENLLIRQSSNNGSKIGNIDRNYFAHAVAPLGPEWCPGTPPDGVRSFAWARQRRGVKILTCAPDWDALFDAIIRPRYDAPVDRLGYAITGYRYQGSCEPSNPLARIAQRTGGTCAEMDWNAPLPTPPLGADANANLAANIARIELTRPGRETSLATLVGSDGRWTGQVYNLQPGVNQLTATLYTTYGQSVSATVNVIAQNNTNRAPHVQDLHVRAIEGQPLSIDLLSTATDPDGDALRVTLAGGAPASLSCSSTGSCVYTGDSNVTVSFTVSDGRGGTAGAQLFIESNQPPTASGYGVRVKRGAAVSLDVFRDASDADGDALALVDWTGSEHGSVGCSAPSTCTYLAAANFSGLDSFEYTLSDGQGGTSTARVTVLVEPLAADAGISLSHSGGEMVIGLERSLDVVVYNVGEAVSGAAIVRVELPSLTYTRFAGTSWSCTQGAQLQCQSSTSVQPGEVYPTLQIFVRPNAEAAPRVYARAVVTVNDDTNAANNSAEDLVSVHAPRVDAAVELSQAKSEVCARGSYVATVHNPGGSSIAGPLTLQATIPAELALASLDAEGWSCATTANGFSCVYSAALAPHEEPPVVEFSFTRASTAFGLRQLTLQLTAAGDAVPANDSAQLALTLFDTQSDGDHDGVVDCADICPSIANAQQSDADGDGVGDACDNCPQATNTAQTDSNHDGAGDACQPVVDLRWVVSDGRWLSSDVDVHDPDGDPVHGQVAIYGGRAKPQRIGIDLLHGCGAGMLRVRLNGQLIATPSWSVGNCVCSTYAPMQTVVLDPNLLAAYDTDSNSNVLSIEMAGGAARQLSWVKAGILFANQETQELCVFDASSSGNCTATNACGATADTVSVQRSLPPTSDLNTYYLATYTDSTPGRVLSLQGVPDGDYSLVVTGTDDKTPQVSDRLSFMHRGESMLDVDPGIDISPEIQVSAFEACGVLRYSIWPLGLGSQPTNASINMRGTFPTGIRVTDLTGSGWQCSWDTIGFECSTDSVVEYGQRLPSVNIEADVRTPPGTLLSFDATVSTPGDANSTNNTAYRSQIVNQPSVELDYDHDGLPACIDACPHQNPNVDADGDALCDVPDDTHDNCVGVFNPTQLDSDDDGIGDACDHCAGLDGGLLDTDDDGAGDECDNCRVNANADQADSNGDGSGDACQPTVQIASIASDPTRLVAEVQLHDPNGDPLHGEVRVIGAPIEFDALAIDTVGVCDRWQVQVKLNGQVIDTYSTNPGACDCAVTAVDTHTIAASKFRGWLRPIDNRVEIDLTPTFTNFGLAALAWVKVASLYSNGLVDEYCVSDAGTTQRCQDVPFDLCVNGFGTSPVHAEQMLATPPLSVVASATYQNSILPPYLDLPGAAPGGYELQVTTDDGTSLPAGARKTFDINGQTRIEFFCQDADGDQICNDADNCPSVSNAGQTDVDRDGIGDACDTCPRDSGNDRGDFDGVCDDVDNCDMLPNPDQRDTDADGPGDACDPCPYSAGDDVTDNDGVCDDVDNCVGVANTDQLDLDSDGRGDACDVCPRDPTDDASDHDGVCDDVDNCPFLANAAQTDADHDGLGDACDTCPNDATDDASDHDGVCDDVDNCRGVVNASQSDADHDGFGDACDACPADSANDVDRDGVCGNIDNCPNVANPSQADADRDGLGDACDTATPSDNDRDGVPDSKDKCPNTTAGQPVNPADGCAIGQLCPCEGGSGNSGPSGWKNHGEYVSCVTHAANDLVAAHVITGAEKGSIVSAAAQSSCGKR